MMNEENVNLNFNKAKMSQNLLNIEIPIPYLVRTNKVTKVPEICYS